MNAGESRCRFATLVADSSASERRPGRVVERKAKAMLDVATITIGLALPLNVDKVDERCVDDVVELTLPRDDDGGASREVCERLLDIVCWSHAQR